MSELITPANVRLVMGLVFFPTGLIAILAGLFMLALNPYRQEAKILAAQSARLNTLKHNADQKIVMDNVAIVAQSATALIQAVDALIRTASGNAIVIIIVGMLFEAAAYWLLLA